MFWCCSANNPSSGGWTCMTIHHLPENYFLIEFSFKVKKESGHSLKWRGIGAVNRQKKEIWSVNSSTVMWNQFLSACFLRHTHTVQEIWDCCARDNSLFFSQIYFHDGSQLSLSFTYRVKSSIIIIIIGGHRRNAFSKQNYVSGISIGTSLWGLKMRLSEVFLHCVLDAKSVSPSSWKWLSLLMRTDKCQVSPLLVSVEGPGVSFFLIVKLAQAPIVSHCATFP